MSGEAEVERVKEAEVVGVAEEMWVGEMVQVGEVGAMRVGEVEVVKAVLPYPLLYHYHIAKVRKSSDLLYTL